MRGQDGSPGNARPASMRGHATSNHARPGAALLLVLLLLFLLDCVMLGAVHLAVTERRLAQNVDTALRLRLHAESAVREGAAAWDAAIDSLVNGAAPRVVLQVTTSDSIEATATIQRIGETAFVLRGEAALLPPRGGRASAVLLLRPPALAPEADPALAALTAGGAVRLGPDATLTADGTALLVHDPADVELFDPTQVLGSIEVIVGPDDVIAQLDRLVMLFDPPPGASSRFHGAEFALTFDFTGTLLVDGNLHVAAGVAVHGLVITRGALVVEADARIEGAVHTGGPADVRGSIVLDRAAVEAAVADAGLREPSPFRGRAWVPGF